MGLLRLVRIGSQCRCILCNRRSCWSSILDECMKVSHVSSQLNGALLIIIGLMEMVPPCTLRSYLFADALVILLAHTSIRTFRHDRDLLSILVQCCQNLGRVIKKIETYSDHSLVNHGHSQAQSGWTSRELEALYMDLSQCDTIDRREWYTSKILLDEQMFKHAWMWIALIDVEWNKHG